MTLPSSVEGSSLESNDAALAARIRTGDEAAFAALVDRYHNAMLRVARSLVRDREVAAEVVQETWLGAVKGIDRFEGRSSLKTWLFSILLNIARTRARREQRSIAFSSVATGEDDDEPAVAADRFSAEGAWISAPADWEAMPEERLLSIETRIRVEAAINELPPLQRQVIALRDVEGWSADEVCNALELTETNQRVILHRARAKVRRALETYLG